MSLARDIAVMRRAGILRVLDEEQLRLLAFGAERITARARDVLWQAGDPAEGGAVVIAGQIHLIRPDGTPLEGLAGVGTLLDETALIVAAAHGFTARAASSSELLLVPRHAVRRVLEEFPEAAGRMHQAVCEWTAQLIEGVAPIAGRLSRDGED